MTKETKDDYKKKLHGFYRHISHLTGKPFYVGRAVQRVSKTGIVSYPRAYEAYGRKRTKEWHEIAQHGYDVEILMEDLTFEQVIAKEEEFVALYGRVKDGGILVNKKKGGDDGHEGFPCSEDTKKLLSEQRTIPLEQKLKESIQYEANGCWTWTATVIHGRPVIHVNKRSQSAKRFLYSHSKTKLKKNQHIHNTCDNPLCVNPSHMGIHYAAKAIRDQSPFTEDDVREIKRLAYFEGMTHADLAKKYGVRRPIITKILLGTNWKWVKVDGVPDVIKSEYHKGKKKAVLCVETGETFDSAKEASISIFKTDKFFRSVRQACSNQTWDGYYKGYHFKFAA